MNLSTEQLKAIHAKKAEIESASKESKKPTVITSPRGGLLSTEPPTKIVLPSQAEPPVDWKNNEDIKRYKRPHLTDEVVNQLLEMVFRYTPGHRKNLTFNNISLKNYQSNLVFLKIKQREFIFARAMLTLEDSTKLLGLKS